MADRSHIEWTDATWNPINGCSVVSPGCTNCYAMKLAGTRLKHHPSRAGLTIDSKAGPVWNGQVRLDEKALPQPLRWKRPRKIFVCAHGDLFHENVPDDWIDRVFAIAALAPQHVYQILTKRPERMRAYLAAPGSPEVLARYQAIEGQVEGLGGQMPANFWFMQHIWLGISAEDQPRWESRWNELKMISGFGPKWASFEPLLGPIDLQVSHDHCDLCGGTGILARWPKGKCHVCAGQGHKPIMGPSLRTHYACLDWAVIGGESGPGARPMHPDWARQLRDQCAEAGVPFLFKQWGAYAPATGYHAEPNVIEASTDVAWPDGTVGAGHQDRNGGPGLSLWPVGKKAAGRLLDGVQHDGYPTGACR